MDILITENQKTFLLSEGVMDNLQEIKESAIDFSAAIYKRASKRFGFNLKILLTFGAAVGGLLQPLEDYIAGRHPHLTEDQRLLVLIAVVAIVFNQGSSMVKTILSKIKEEGLTSEFRDGMSKSKSLLMAFKGFLGTLGNSGAFLSDVMSYIYMIPLLGYLTISIGGTELSDGQIDLLVSRLLTIGVFTLSSAALEEIVKRIVGR
jgi:hypothetical protein